MISEIYDLRIAEYHRESAPALPTAYKTKTDRSIPRRVHQSEFVAVQTPTSSSFHRTMTNLGYCHHHPPSAKFVPTMLPSLNEAEPRSKKWQDTHHQPTGLWFQHEIDYRSQLDHTNNTICHHVRGFDEFLRVFLPTPDM